MLGAPFKPYFGLSGIMALDVPLTIPAGIVIAFIYMLLGWIYGAIPLATHHTNLPK
jgi:hypothetical protein